MRLTVLTKPVTRRVKKMVVTITPEGVTMRGYKRRKGSLRVSWAQVASLAPANQPVIRLAENVDGKRQLQAMGAAEKGPTG